MGWLFIVTGIVGLSYHATEFNPQGGFDYETAWVLVVRVLAIVAGGLMLRGSDWGRWLALAWVAYHVFLSASHSVAETVMHVLVFAACALVLLRPRASAHSRGPGQPAA